MSKLVAAKTRLVETMDRMLYGLYYRFIFGRRVPMGQQVAARVSAWEQYHRKGDIPFGQALWENQYQSGIWACLGQLSELARYSIIIGYLTELKPRAAVLDVGCGEGLLFSRYRHYGYERYVGIDISAAALAKLRPAEDGKTAFICADAETYVPVQSFDALIFNETLYYFHEPLAVADRYVSALDRSGIVIVSTYEGSLRARSILRALKAKYSLMDETRISHSALSWSCSIFRP
jgi:SAM-dependent methyltransferase